MLLQKQLSLFPSLVCLKACLTSRLDGKYNKQNRRNENSNLYEIMGIKRRGTKSECCCNKIKLRAIIRFQNLDGPLFSYETKSPWPSDLPWMFPNEEIHKSQESNVHTTLSKLRLIEIKKS